MQITTTNQILLNLYKALQDSKECKGLDFAKAVISNSDVIKDHLQYIEDMTVPSEEFIKISIEAKKYMDSEDLEALQKMEAKEENAGIIAERKEQLAKVNEELQKEVTLDLAIIKEETLPKDISVANYEVMKVIIK
jgi:hypothetical protein